MRQTLELVLAGACFAAGLACCAGSWRTMLAARIGLGGAVAERLVQIRPVPLERVGIADTFAESGPYADLLEKYGMGVESIVGAVHRVLARKSARS